MGKIPTIRYKLRIRVICEGLEEFEYFKRLLKLNVWNEKYDFNPINVILERSNIWNRYLQSFRIQQQADDAEFYLFVRPSIIVHQTLF